MAAEQVRRSVKLRLLRALTARVPPVRGFDGLWLAFWFAFLFLLFLIDRIDRGRPERKLIEADVLGFKMELDPGELVDCTLLLFPQLYDFVELRFLREQLRPGDVFLDVGAHIGLYSAIASRSVGKEGIVLAVEADPTIYRRLSSALVRNLIDNVRAINVGVSDRDGTLSLGILPRPLRAGSSFLVEGGDGIDVPCRTLLGLLQEHGISRVRGAKFDIEGYEYRVLDRFLRDAPRDAWPQFVILEFQRNLLARAGGNSLDLLRSHGYRIQDRCGMNYVLVRGEPGQG